MKKKLLTTKQSNSNDKVDWQKEIELDPSIKPTSEMINEYQQKVLLDTETEQIIFMTGATGFLGIYLLRDLIQSSNCKLIYCLIRNKLSKEQAMETLIQLFKEHKIYDQLNEDHLKKIQPVLGCISKDLFGLSNQEYNQLSNEVDIVLNSAANISWNSQYKGKSETMEGINQCIKLSCSLKLKRLLQVSSTGIYSSLFNQEIHEHLIPPFEKEILDNPSMNGYFQCKLVAEYRLKEAASRGIPIITVRPPFIFPSPETGILRGYNLSIILIQACYIMKVYPSESIIYPKFYAVPVTWVSKVISCLMYKGWNQAQHSPNFTGFNVFGGSIDMKSIILRLARDLSWRPIQWTQFMKKLSIYDNESCTALSQFCQQRPDFLDNLSTDNNYIASDSLTQLLDSNNCLQDMNISEDDNDAGFVQGRPPHRISPSALSNFRNSIKGLTFMNGEVGYVEACNNRWDLDPVNLPYLIVQPFGEKDIKNTLQFIKTYKLKLAVKSGGHSIESATVGGVLIDLVHMKKVTIDKNRSRVTVEAGCTLHDIDPVTNAAGYATVLGEISSVGISGYCLGGGIGHLTKAYGMCIDQLIEAEMFLADGTQLTVNKDQNTDLFWGIRGAGSFLGLVTSFTLKLYPIRNVTLGKFTIGFDPSSKDALVKIGQNHLNKTDQLTYSININSGSIVIKTIYLGSDINYGKQIISEFGSTLTTIEPPFIDTINYNDIQNEFDGIIMPGKYYQEGPFIRTTITPEIADIVLDMWNKHPTKIGSIIFTEMGPLMNAPSSTDTAFPVRDSTFNIFYTSAIIDESLRQAIIDWTTEGVDRLKPYTSDSERYLMYALIHLADCGIPEEYTDSILKLFKSMLQVDNGNDIKRRSIGIQGIRIVLEYNFKFESSLPLELICNSLVPMFDEITEGYVDTINDVNFILISYSISRPETFSPYLEVIVKNFLKVMDFTHTRKEQLEYQYKALLFLTEFGEKNSYNKDPVLLEHIMSGILKWIACVDDINIETWGILKIDCITYAHSPGVIQALSSLIDSHCKLVFEAMEKIRSSFMESSNWKYRFSMIQGYYNIIYLKPDHPTVMNQFPKIIETVLLKFSEDPDPFALNTATTCTNPCIISLALSLIHTMIQYCHAESMPYHDKIMKALPSILRGNTKKSFMLTQHVMVVIDLLKGELKLSTYYESYFPILLINLTEYANHQLTRSLLVNIIGQFFIERFNESQNYKNEANELMKISLTMEHKFGKIYDYVIHTNLYLLAQSPQNGSNFAPFRNVMGQLFLNFFETQTDSDFDVTKLQEQKIVVDMLNIILNQRIIISPLSDLVLILQGLLNFFKSIENCTLDEVKDLKFSCLESLRLLLLKQENTQSDEKSIDIMYKEIFQFIVPRLTKYQTEGTFVLFYELIFQISNCIDLIRVSNMKIEIFPDLSLLCKQLKIVFEGMKKQNVFPTWVANNILYIVKSLIHKQSYSEPFQDMFQTILEYCSIELHTLIPVLPSIFSDYILSGSPKLLEHFPIIIPALIRFSTDESLYSRHKAKAVRGLMYAAYISREKFEPYAIKALGSIARVLNYSDPNVKNSQQVMIDIAVCGMIWIITALPSNLSQEIHVYYKYWSNLLPLQVKLHYYPLIFEAMVTLFERHGFQKIFPHSIITPMIKTLNLIGFGLRKRLIDKEIRERLKKILENEDNLKYFKPTVKYLHHIKTTLPLTKFLRKIIHIPVEFEDDEEDEGLNMSPDLYFSMFQDYLKIQFSNNDELSKKK
eukprot:gene1551-1963_t